MRVHQFWPGALLTLAGLLLATSPAAAQFGRGGPPMTVVTGGTVHTGTGDVIENGIVLIRRGKIVAVGAGLPVPDGANVIDASGRHVYPGLIDADSTLLIDPASRGGGAPNPTARARDAIDLFQPRVLEDALSQGVTAVHASPHRGLLDGAGVVLKLKPGAALDDVLLKDGGSLSVQYGSLGGRPSVMLRNFKTLDNELKAARKYIEQWDEYAEKLEEYEKELEKLRKEEGEEEPKEDKAKDEKPAEEKEGDEPAEEGKGKEGEKEGEGDEGRRRRRDRAPEWLTPYLQDPPPRRGPPRRGGPPSGNSGDAKKEDKKDEKKDEGPKKPKKPGFDPKKEMLRKVLEGELGVFARAYDAADILNLLDLQAKYHFRLTLAGAREAHKVSAAIKDARVPVVLSQSATPDEKSREAAAGLAKAGVTFAISAAGSNSTETRFLALSGSAAVAGGLDAGRALRAMTADAARIVGVADRIGSLQEGKDADLVIASGPPLASASVVERVLVDGEVVFER